MLIDIIQVINPDSGLPVEYASVIKHPLHEEVDHALKKLGLDENLPQCERDEIVHSLKNGRPYCVMDQHCFLRMGLLA